MTDLETRTKMCSKCKEEKEIGCFSRTSKSTKGHWYRNSQCNSCRTAHHREKYFGGRKQKRAAVTDTHRECMLCKEMFLYKECRGSYCKPCWKVKYYNKEKAKGYTKKYREQNNCRWRALHRIHQFNRRNKIRAADDGTVTDEFLKMVLGTETCFWCKKKVDEDERTIEHVVELSCGGMHSATNIVMACFSCNSSRINKDRSYDRHSC